MEEWTLSVLLIIFLFCSYDTSTNQIIYLGDRAHGFTTTTEYFQYVIGQDLEQLARQPNSTVDFHDARSK